MQTGNKGIISFVNRNMYRVNILFERGAQCEYTATELKEKLNLLLIKHETIAIEMFVSTEILICKIHC